MPAIHAARRTTLRAKAAALGLDAFLVTDVLNIRYLTGFTGSNAALLVGTASEEATVFCTDGRYVTQSSEQVADLERVIDRPCDLALITRAAGGVIGFEGDAVSVNGHAELLHAAGESVALQAVSYLVEDLRAVKDAGEIELLRQACAVADTGLEDLLSAGELRPGRTEREVSLDLDERMRRLGAEDVAFETIVAAGANSAIPHHRPTVSVINTGDFVKIDFGARFAGYHSDMTRTFVMGEPADWQREVYDVVSAAQEAGRLACMPGSACTEVDAVARQVIENAGYGEFYLHGLGHGIGLEIHEAPTIGSVSTGIIASDMVVTVEPGIYLPGRGGVRIEDSGVVRPGGYELLTLTTKDLVVL
ncbi:aminopeptidase P family protein [Nakamurella antarctica]|uniref:Aminopeptidase P family protein n=1 Tax=Nakamurella antarctica TaxID=1902245 RepID=A0A3G8ZJL7_9ACTN|nr:aminopeptidase P family protein [Nakamurella antarctica]AZI57463.1 aminopeptidase P family protein [Nakamurella antarctica]